MIYLDSDVAIKWMHKRISQTLLLERVPEDETIAITTPSLYEIYQGFYIMQWDKKKKKGVDIIEREREAIENLRRTVIEVPWDGAAAQKSAEIYQNLASKGELLDEFDCMIAGTILTHVFGSLMTMNSQHFARISELQIISI